MLENYRFRTREVGSSAVQGVREDESHVTREISTQC